MILDTDILSALSDPQCPERVIKALARASEPVFTTAVNWAEVCYGLARRPGRQSQQLRERYEELIVSSLAIIDFDRESAEAYAELRAELERRGQRLAEGDLMVASIALRHDMTLVSGNTRHLARIPGLKLESWLEG